MKKLIFLLAIYLPLNLVAQLDVNFKGGYNLSRLDSDPHMFEATARLGWHFGMDLRFGKDFVFVPGVMFYKIQTDLKNKEEIAESSFKKELLLHAFRIPVNLGAMIVDKENFKLFAHAGPSFWIPVDVTNDDTGIEIDGIRPFWIGGNVVAGFQIWKITLDACYDSGLTPVNEHVKNSTNNSLSFSIGYAL